MSRVTRPSEPPTPMDVLAGGAYVVAGVVAILVFFFAFALLMSAALEAGR